ncbi:hypothetical protein ESZ50_07420 [Weissella muntiaci]|uniref:Uncharacterized protein n=1 Tax=Weissella muntiaci TaxID=2508881 RepID=A0A6C2C5E0_9LACO|nr:hypothetical protein [Weissella muntiaci]TYC49067.1 hypothetical protein ESZ50_07420 [Weissella muntiaci]
MTKLSERVEILEIKNGYKLFQIAYAGNGRYLLYKVFTPWYGFLNVLPFICVTRPAQIIGEDQALLYSYKREVNKTDKGIRTSLAMIIAVILGDTALVLTSVMNIYGIKQLLLVLGVGLWLIIHIIYGQKASEKNELIRNYQPNTTVSLQSNNLIGRFIVLVFFLLTLIPMPNFQIFIIPFFGFHLLPMLFDFYPDQKSLAETGNKIMIFGETGICE